MISLVDYWEGRDKQFPPSEEQIEDATDLLDKIELLEEAYGEELTLTSGYRPAEINALIPNAVRGDAHERCQGIDLHDPDKALSKWLIENLDILEELGLWMESPKSAKTHVHLQSYSPRSGKRVFLA